VSLWARFRSWWQGEPEWEAQGGEDLVARNAIDRSVLVVRAAEPFKRWAARVSGEKLNETREALAKDHTAYLIPLENSQEAGPELLGQVYAEIFERELMSWHCDRAQWPEPRTLEMFGEWFELETCTLAIDLVDAPIGRAAG